MLNIALDSKQQELELVSFLDNLSLLSSVAREDELTLRSDETQVCSQRDCRKYTAWYFTTCSESSRFIGYRDTSARQGTGDADETTIVNGTSNAYTLDDVETNECECECECKRPNTSTWYETWCSVISQYQGRKSSDEKSRGGRESTSC